MKDVERRLQLLEDVEAIKNLKARFCAYQDDKNSPEGLASLFADNGVWYARDGEIRGPEAIRKYCASRQGDWPFTKHYVVNPIITVDGDEAHGTWELFMAGTLAQGNQAVWLALRLEEDYVRVDGEWKYEAFRVGERYFNTPFEKGWAQQRFV